MLREKSLAKVVTVVILLLAISILPADAQAPPKKGGSLKIISTMGEVRTLGPSYDMRLTVQIFYTQPVFEGFLRFDDKGLPAPNLAESWKIANDHKSITFSLKKGGKFHDGTDFDAEAVKFNFENFTKTGRFDLEAISSIDVLDKYTLRLNLDYFSNILFPNLAYWGGLISSPTAIQKMGVEEFGRNPIGTGPFKFKSWQRDLSIKYERFDGYWQKGKPYVDEIEFLHIKDPMTAGLTFMGGDASAIFDLLPSQAAEMQKSGRYDIKKIRYAHMIGLIGDSENPDSPYSKLKVRQAVSHALDSKAMNDSIFQGFNDVTNQFSGPKSWAYNKDVVGYPHDPQKAKRLLAEAGYPNGFKTTLWWVTGGVNPQIAAAIQAYLKDVGIDAEVQLLELTAWVDLFRKGWKNGMVMFGCGQAHPDDLRSMLYLTNKYKWWKSMDIPMEIDDLVFKGIKTPDFNTKVAIARECNRVLTDKYCLVNFTMITNSLCAVKKDVRDSGLFEVALPYFKPADVYFSK